MPALFGWQGLSLRYPDDWAPVVLSGDRRSGYARLASPRALSLQIRWAPLGQEILSRSLNRYLDRLARDARRKRSEFSCEVHSGDDLLRYRYRGEIDGEGLLFPTDDGRVAFLEAVGESTTARCRLIERTRDSFGTGSERWSLLGLDLTLPGPLEVEKKELFAGRTALTLSSKGVRVVAERWGLAESLLSKMSLEQWAAGRLGRGWHLQQADEGIYGSRNSNRFTRRAYDEFVIKSQPGLNQITLVHVQTRREAWRPQWDWLS